VTSFLDTNVILRFLLRDDEQKYQRSLRLLKRCENGEEDLETTHLTIAEAAWVLAGRPYKLEPSEIRDRLIPIVALEHLRLPDKALLADALRLYAHTGVDYADAYTAAVMRKHGLDRIYSYDTDFDRIPGLTRAEP